MERVIIDIEDAGYKLHAFISTLFYHLGYNGRPDSPNAEYVEHLYTCAVQDIVYVSGGPADISAVMYAGLPDISRVAHILPLITQTDLERLRNEILMTALRIRGFIYKLWPDTTRMHFVAEKVARDYILVIPTQTN